MCSRELSAKMIICFIKNYAIILKCIAINLIMQTHVPHTLSKSTLFDSIKAKGLFWSYAPTISYSLDKDNLLCEIVLKYGDIEDIHNLFALYGESTVREIWEKAVKPDSRFKRLNYFIARVFFNLDVEASDFENLQHERIAKFRLLAN